MQIHIFISNLNSGHDFFLSHLWMHMPCAEMEEMCRSQRWACFHSPPMWPARMSSTASRCPWATAAGRTHTAPLSFSTSSPITVPFSARCLHHTLISKPSPSVLILHSAPPLQRYDNTSHAIHTDNTVLRGALLAPKIIFWKALCHTVYLWEAICSEALLSV